MPGTGGMATLAGGSAGRFRFWRRGGAGFFLSVNQTGQHFVNHNYTIAGQ